MRIVYIENNNSVVQKVNFQILKKLGYLDTNDAMIFKNSKCLTQSEIQKIINHTDIIFCNNDLGSDLSGLDFFESISREYHSKMVLLTEDTFEIMPRVMEFGKKLEVIACKNNSYSLQIKTIKRLGEVIKEYKLKGREYHARKNYAY